MEEHSSRIRSFTVRQGRISKGQRKALDTLSERYCLPLADRHIDFSEVFENKPVIMEIGFGMGLATAEMAEKYPDRGFLGIEVYPAGVGKLLGEIERRSLQNVRIIRSDVVTVLERMIPDNAITGVHIFFPDPWPKKRHHKRRLIQRGFLELLETKMCSKSYLLMVTDWVEYSEWMLKEVAAVEGLENPHDTFAPHAPWRPKTKFEQKGLAKGHEIREIYITKGK